MADQPKPPLFMRPTTAVTLAVLAGLSFVLALWLGAYGGEITRGRDPGAHALSRSAVGYAGLVQLLQFEGVTTALTDKATAAPNNGGLLVVTPTADPAADALRRLTARGPVLVILPKWQATRDPNHPGWVANGSATGPSAVSVLTALGLKDFKVDLETNKSFWTLSWRLARAVGIDNAPGDRRTANIDSFQSMPGNTLLPVLLDDKGRTILGRMRDREVFILTEPDLLNNQGLATVDGAALATDIVGTLSNGGPVTFDLTFGVPGVGRNALKLLFEPPLASVSLCALLAALLAAIQAFIRFGPVMREPRALDFSKASLVESAASLLEAAKREPKIAPRYLDLMAGATARLMGLSSSLDGPQRDAELDRLSLLRSLTPLSRLAADAKAVKTRPALTAWAQDVYQWSVEMTRGRR